MSKQGLQSTLGIYDSKRTVFGNNFALLTVTFRVLGLRVMELKVPGLITLEPRRQFQLTKKHSQRLLYGGAWRSGTRCLKGL